jgi:hypothetical protein
MEAKPNYPRWIVESTRAVRGSIRDTLPVRELATHRASRPIAIAVGMPPTPIVVTTELVAWSKRTIAPAVLSATQTAPKPTATALAPTPTATVWVA